jgi:hypothetical protein
MDDANNPGIPSPVYRAFFSGFSQSRLVVDSGVRLYGSGREGFAMPRRGVKHMHRKLTTDESNRVAKARRLIAGEEQEIRCKAREYKLAYEAARSTSKASQKQTRAKEGREAS